MPRGKDCQAEPFPAIWQPCKKGDDVGIRSERLRAALEARQMTPYRLAQVSGVSESYLSRILSGQRGEKVSAERAAALATALKVRVGFLLGDGGPMDEEEVPPPAPRVRRLRERGEWAAARDAVVEQHPELGAPDIDAVGDLFDDPETFPSKIDPAFVHGFAVVFRDWRARALARR